MLDDKPNRDIIERAEDLILRLREVQSVRIYADEQGAISEVHVVAATERAPKLIARDVESCLKASLGLSVDYRKIGVVVIEPGKERTQHYRTADGALHAGSHAGSHDGDPIIELEDVVEERLSEKLTEPGKERPRERFFEWPRERAEDRPAPIPVSGRGGPEPARRDPEPAPSETPGTASAAIPGGARLEFLEVDARVRLKGLRVSVEEDRIDAEVRLARGPLAVTGSQGDYRFQGKLFETVAGAALHAVSELLDENIRLCLSGVQEVSLGGRKTLCVVVSVLEGRQSTSYVGCSIIGEEQGESAVLAVLDALNRPLGTWKLRTSIHYTIK